MDDRVGSEYWGTPEFEEYVSHFTDLMYVRKKTMKDELTGESDESRAD